MITTEEKLVLLNGTALEALREIPRDHPAAAGQQATTAPLPLIIVITAPGIAFFALRYGKKTR